MVIVSAIFRMLFFTPFILILYVLAGTFGGFWWVVLIGGVVFMAFLCLGSAAEAEEKKKAEILRAQWAHDAMQTNKEVRMFLAENASTAHQFDNIVRPAGEESEDIPVVKSSWPVVDLDK